jgi:alcohol dehydrogenase class IV
MAYAVAGRVRDYVPDGYPAPADLPALVPHGFAVAVNAPAAFAFLESTSPERHAEASRLLGGDGALNDTMAAIMRDVGAPNGTSGVGYTAADIPDLVASAAPQRRLLDNAPAPVFEDELTELFGLAERCW